MDMPRYKGLLEPWKVDLIRMRARRIGFARHQMPDAMQEAALALLDFQYDPAHDAGAKQRTALITVIDNRLLNLKRSASRYGAHMDRLADLTSKGCDHIDQRAVDVAEVVASLPNREQLVCRHLANGWTKAAIAADLGCGWHTVDRIIRSLRARFEELDLVGWLS